MLKIKKGRDVVKEIKSSDLNIEFPCDGKGKCGKCKVKVISGSTNLLTESEKSLLSSSEQIQNVRLACLLSAKTDIVVENLNRDLEIETELLVTNLGKDYSEFVLGIDLGTSTIEIVVYDLNTLQSLKSIKILNPQVKYGADILARLKYYSESIENAKRISSKIINVINELDIIDQCEQIYIAGNTAMQLIFLSEDINDLLTPPFLLKHKKYLKRRGRDIGINMKENGTVLVFPALESYIGGDIYSGLAYYLMKNPATDNQLLIDIGTNAEIVYITKDKYYTVSTPAGPAFEGGNISCGMRAESGALKSITIDNKLSYEVIGATELSGICGSALVQSISELYYNEFIDNTGRLREINMLYPDLNKLIKDNKFYISDKVYLTQSDIREFQLAKAAIRAALETLLEILKINIMDIKKIIISGNFGKNLSKESLINLGVLPRIETEKIIFEENLVIKGLDEEIKRKNIIKNVEKILSKIEYINLAENEKFKKNYIKSINF